MTRRSTGSCSLRLKRTLGSRALGGNLQSCSSCQGWEYTEELEQSGSMGVLSNFHLPVSCAAGWPRINESREYRGPLSAKCSCGTQHESIKSQRASSSAIHATVCAEFLTALHRLPRDMGEVQRGKIFLNDIYGIGKCEVCFLSF